MQVGMTLSELEKVISYRTPFRDQ